MKIKTIKFLLKYTGNLFISKNTIIIDKRENIVSELKLKFVFPSAALAKIGY